MPAKKSIRTADSEPRPEVLVLLSGGIDSAACMDFYLGMARAVCALHVGYGQAAEVQERRAAVSLARFYGVRLDFRRLEMADPKSVGEVQGRNAFLVLTAMMERPPSVTAIALGIHSGTAYPDCSEEFVESLNALLHVHAHRVEVVAPFLEWRKEHVLSLCEQRNVPMHLTYSCETGGDIPCGECLSCLDRRGVDARA